MLILRNWPFARRSYIFKTDYIQKYFEKQPWYTADKEYQVDTKGLTLAETQWIKGIEEIWNKKAGISKD